MKSRQLLSVVFSLIMFTGVTAGSAAAAFAESDNDNDDDLDDILEDFCESDIDSETLFEQNPDLVNLSTEITEICAIEDEDKREDAIDEFITEYFPDAMEEEDGVIEDFEDCVEANGVIGNNPDECIIDGMVFVNNDDDDDDDYDDANKVLVCHKGKNTLSIDDDALPAHLGHGDDEGPCDGDARADYMHDKYYSKSPEDLRDHMEMFCDMTIEEREAKVDEKHPDLDDDLRDELLGYCEMSEENQDDFRDSMMDRMYKHHDSMTSKMTDNKKHHMDYDKLCSMAEPNRAAVVDDAEKLERISQWCEMTPEEREDYKKERHDKTNNEKHEMKMKLSEKSDRIKAMIMDKRDISDERMDEIKMKYIKKHGDLTDKQKSELKTKFEKHMKTIKHKISDERKSAIHERLAEMKAFKAELREKSPDLTDEEKQQLREEFIERAKDMQLAWITPRTQMTAGVDAAEVQCREGFSLAMKASNGVAMCLKADTALKMIDRGIAVPAN